MAGLGFGRSSKVFQALIFKTDSLPSAKISSISFGIQILIYSHMLLESVLLTCSLRP
jgi:hypothetical protein